MNYNRLKKESPWTSEARTTVLFGFLLRLAMLIFIIYIMEGTWDLYYIEDDKKYEELAALYLANAHNVFDMELFDALTNGYAAKFWPFVMCISAKIFRFFYIGRFINALLSTCCIAATYKLTFEVSNSQKTALLAARLFAFLPFSILVACFPIKDIFIMLGTLYAFFIFVRVQRGRTVSIAQIILLAVFLVCIYLSRGAVTELLLMFFLVYYLQKLYKGKKYLSSLFLLIFAVALLFAFRSTIFGSFATKIDTYGNYAADEASGLNIIRVTGITDIYKLPIAYAFAMLQPLQLELFTIAGDTRPWRTVMTYVNITMYPIAMGAWLYMFCKKHNLFFWLSSFVMFASVIMLSLGVNRHYLFMLPIHMINFSLYISEKVEQRRSLIILGTLALFMLVFTYSLVKLL